MKSVAIVKVVENALLVVVPAIALHAMVPVFKKVLRIPVEFVKAPAHAKLVNVMENATYAEELESDDGANHHVQKAQK
jgi:hypothetical protein